MCGDGHTSNPHLLKGVDLYHQQKYQQAVDEYTICISEDPKNIDAYSNRALANKELNQLPAVKDDLDKIVELNPSDAQAYTNRGSVNKELGKY